MTKIPLVNGDFALVDDEDAEIVLKHRWYGYRPHNVSYAQATLFYGGKRQTIKMHRVVMREGDSHVLIDHINGDGLDNRKENLRRVAPSQNQANMRSCDKNKTSRFKGVSLKPNGKWFAQLQYCGKKQALGYFATESEAAAAYNEAARAAFGQYACLNDVPGDVVPHRLKKTYDGMKRDKNGRYVPRRSA